MTWMLLIHTYGLVEKQYGEGRLFPGHHNHEICPAWMSFCRRIKKASSTILLWSLILMSLRYSLFSLAICRASGVSAIFHVAYLSTIFHVATMWSLYEYYFWGFFRAFDATRCFFKGLVTFVCVSFFFPFHFRYNPVFSHALSGHT